MEYTKVSSSNINELGHEGNTLKVRFKAGTEYHYSNVPKEIFDQIVAAASVGRSFNELIKSHASEYPFTRVT